MYEVQDNVPIPPIARKSTRTKYPFETMQPGAMFFVPGGNATSIKSYSTSVGKELGMKFSIRSCAMQKLAGHWRVCNIDDPNAVEGVGVWRVK